MLNRIAASSVGRYFTDIDGNEYVGFVPIAALSFIGLFVAVVSAALMVTWMPLLWWLMISGGAAAPLGTLSLTAVSRDTRLADAVRDYYRLSRDERRELPHRLDKVLIREKNPSLTREAISTMDTIVSQRAVMNEPRTQEIIRELAATREAINESMTKYKELM